MKIRVSVINYGKNWLGKNWSHITRIFLLIGLSIITKKHVFSFIHGFPLLMCLKRIFVLLYYSFYFSREKLIQNLLLKMKSWALRLSFDFMIKDDYVRHVTPNKTNKHFEGNNNHVNMASHVSVIIPGLIGLFWLVNFFNYFWVLYFWHCKAGNLANFRIGAYASQVLIASPLKISGPHFS